MNLRIRGAFTLLTVCLLAVGCSSSKTASTPAADVGEEDTATDEDVAVTADAADAKVGDTIPPKDIITKDGVVTPDVPVGKDSTDPVDVAPDATKKLPLPACAAGDCAKCKTDCPAAAQCSPDKKTTYFNDCDAICTLNLEAGLDATWTAGACPACDKCTAADKPATGWGTDPAAGWCVKMNDGSQKTVSMECESKCMTNVKSVAKGACVAKCSQPVGAGGAGCSGSYQPVCATQDSKTYGNTCKMQACDVDGCYPAGETAKTAKCAPKAMTKECDGECYDATKNASCPSTCNPVCAITKTGAGQSFRSACIATAAGAKVANCDGVSATKADICAASVLYNNRGCCEDVDYATVKPVCGVQKTTDSEAWVTFRNQSEYNCLTAGQTGWTVKYASPCVCNCPDTGDAVCGSDKLTYTNDCQAKCYNGPNFVTTAGACP